MYKFINPGVLILSYTMRNEYWCYANVGLEFLYDDVDIVFVGHCDIHITFLIIN